MLLAYLAFVFGLFYQHHNRSTLVNSFVYFSARNCSLECTELSTIVERLWYLVENMMLYTEKQ